MQRKLCCAAFHGGHKQACKNGRHLYHRWENIINVFHRNSSTCRYDPYINKGTDKPSPHADPETKPSQCNNSSTLKDANEKLPTVGVVFDIDGVLVRGREIINTAKEALNKLQDLNVPFAYLTNGGCETEEHKAQALSNRLGISVNPSQVILSHSPLRVLKILHDKHVLVSGQGPVSEIAEMCGFSRVCHVDDIDCHFPELDVNDKKKRERLPCIPKKPFAPIEGILMMGEPVNWEKTLQIIIDVILAEEGVPNNMYTKPQQQMPVVAVNTDYLWMSEAVNPRLGHGGFLLCLEALYEKLTGKRLEYNTILGKPCLFTYRYTQGVLLNLARQKFGDGAKVHTIYAIGDNPNTDIYGANVYNNYLKAIRGSKIKSDLLHPESTVHPERMKSILVRTGVYGAESTEVWASEANHLHRDTVYRPELSVPTHEVEDVLDAVNVILKEEGLIK